MPRGWAIASMVLAEEEEEEAEEEEEEEEEEAGATSSWAGGCDVAAAVKPVALAAAALPLPPAPDGSCSMLVCGSVFGAGCAVPASMSPCC